MKVSLLYMGLQLVVSLGFVYLCPDTVEHYPETVSGYLELKFSSMAIRVTKAESVTLVVVLLAA